MMAKTAVTDLQPRGSAPLHRTFPMWAREPKGEGVVEWRMYRGMKQGGALLVAFHSSPGMSRTDVAKGLRTFRDVLFGRDKIKGSKTIAEQPATTDDHQPHEPDPQPPPTNEQGAPVLLSSSEAQGNLF